MVRGQVVALGEEGSKPTDGGSARRGSSWRVAQVAYLLIGFGLITLGLANYLLIELFV